MKLVTIVGTRPQFIKAAPLSLALKRIGEETGARIDEILVHTGQHYDHELSGLLFEQLELDAPRYNLGIGSASQAEQTGAMLAGIERTLVREQPDAVLVYGDCNSTLAGALAAKKLNLPLAHVEAGLRSFNRAMPEEINRIATDAISDVLYCPTEQSMLNLCREGREAGARLVGDVMYDANLLFAGIAERMSGILAKLQLGRKAYALATIHRAENTDDPPTLRKLFAALDRLAEDLPLVLPLHPRTRALMERAGIDTSRSSVRACPPVGYLDMILLERNAGVILTDSGGVQKEAFFSRVPCVTLRGETEWIETVDLGWNRVVGSDPDCIVDAARSYLRSSPAETAVRPYGNGDASRRIAGSLIRELLQ